MAQEKDITDDDTPDTSSQSESYTADQEFDVEEILAEKRENGKKFFLIRWKDYPEDESTWEPKSNIVGNLLLDAWKKRKKLEREGNPVPFDVAKFEARLAKQKEEKADRHRRRKAKRKRLGRPVSPSPSAPDPDDADDSDSSVEAAEENAIEDVPARKSPPKRKKSISPAKQVKKPLRFRGRGSDVQQIDNATPVAEPTPRPLSNNATAPKRIISSTGVEQSKPLLHAAVSSSTFLSNHRQENQRPGSSSSDVSLSKQRPAQRTAPIVLSMVSSREGSSPEETASPRDVAIGSRDSLSLKTASSSSRGGKSATRGGTKMAAKNVFQSREPTKMRGDLLTNAMDPTKQPKNFTNKHLERKAYLQGRDRADRAIDPELLPGGLINPSDGSSVQPIRPSTLRKTSLIPQNEAESSSMDTLFVDEDETPTIEIPVATRGHPLSKGYQICHYWFNQQNDSNKPPCQRGVQCDFLHEFRSGALVAPPPPAKFFPLNLANVSTDGGSLKPFSKPPTVCYFFDLQQTGASKFHCIKGAACDYLHEYLEGAQVARPPHGFVPPATMTAANRTTDSPALDSPGGSLPSFNNGSLSVDSSKDTPAPTPWRANLSNIPSSNQIDLNAGPATLQRVLSTLSSIVSPPQVEPAHPPCDPMDPENAICYFWATNKSCKKGASCRYVHSDQKHLRIAPPPSNYRPLPEVSPQEVSRPPWDYNNPHHAICYFWANHDKSCTKGHACKFVHSEDKHLPIAPSPNVQQRETVCRFWLIGDCYRGDSCHFLHEHPRANETNFTEDDLFIGHQSHESPANLPTSRPLPAEIPLPNQRSQTKSGTKSVKFAEDTPNLTQTSEDIGPSSNISKRGVVDSVSRRLCPSLANGNCLFGKTCWYRHEDSTGKGPDSSAMDIDMPPLDSRYPYTAPPVPLRRASKDLSMGDPDYQQAETSNQDQIMSGLPVTESLIDASTPSSNTLQLVAPKAKRKIHMKDYQRKKASEALGSRTKWVVFGSEETKSLLLDFSEMSVSDQPAWMGAFLAQPKITFSQMCMAKDFEAQQGFLQRQKLAIGSLTSVQGDSNTLEALGKIVDELVLRSIGLMARLEDFAILVFPARKEEWKFLETESGTNDMPLNDIPLRFFIFHCEFDISHTYGSEAKILQPYRMTMVQRMHGLQLKNLLPYCEKGQNAYHFYLLFPSDAGQSEEFIATWIKTCKPDSEVYSSRDEGSWDFFTTSPKIEAGVVLVHQAFTELHQMPNIHRVANENNKKVIALWWISDSDKPYPFYPSRYLPEVPTSRISVVRLFPHGCAFLLAPSFLVAEPQKAYELLNWFLGGKKPKYRNTTPRSWKLVCCHRFSDYILEVANAKAAEKEDFEKQNHDKPAKDAMLKEKGLSFDHCEFRYKMHEILAKLDAQDLLKDSSDTGEPSFDSDASQDTESPMVHVDRFVDPDDEAALIEWFAGWAMRKLDTYKRFVVVGTNPKSVNRMSRMKEIEATQVEELTTPTAKFQTFSLETKTAFGDSLISHPKSDKDRAMAPLAGASGIAAKNKKPSSPALATSQSIKEASSIRTTGINVPNHEINENLSSDTRTFMAQTGGTAQDAQRYGADDDLAGAMLKYQDRDAFDGPLTKLIQTDAGGQMKSVPQCDGAEDRPTSSASNSSKLSRSGIQTSEDGQPFVPRSIRPDGTIRKASPVKPGYSPPEDVESWRPRAFAGASSPEDSRPTSRRNSGNSAMDIDSGSASETLARGGGKTPRKSKSRWQVNPETVIKEIKYEPTTTWYENLKAKGGGWEHIFVASPEHAFTVMNVGK